MAMFDDVAIAIRDSLNGATEDWPSICARAALDAMRTPSLEVANAAIRVAEEGGSLRAVWNANLDAILAGDDGAGK